MSNSERPGMDVLLPSLGKPYGGSVPGGLVTVSAMRTVEEKLFGGLTKRGDFETVIDTLIKRCVSLPDKIKPEDLYLGDRVFLIMQIRAASYGVNYTFRATCESCQGKWDHQVNLTEDLEVREVQDDWEDPFEIELPYSGDNVTLRLFRGTHEKMVVDFVERQHKRVNTKTVGDPAYVYRHALHVVQVKSKDPEQCFGGVDSDIRDTIGPAMQWFEQLVAQDSSEIREAIDSRTPGILLSQSVDCPKCGVENQVVLQMTADFFRSRPSTSSGVHTATRTTARDAR